MKLIEMKKTFNKTPLLSSFFSIFILVALLLIGVTALAQGSGGLPETMRTTMLIEKGCCHSVSSFNDYISDPNFGFAPSHKIHVGLIPIPYAEDILNAKIYSLH